MLGYSQRMDASRGLSITLALQATLMIDDMGVFRTAMGISAIDQPDCQATLENVMVDTGSEYSWAPEAPRRCRLTGTQSVF